MKTENDKQIEIYKQYETTYAVKIQYNNKFYLKYYDYESNKPVVNKFEITSHQYNKLLEGKEYLTKIQFKKKKDSAKGTVKEILTENHVN